MKLLNDRCLECSIWAIFFNSSLTVSITALSSDKNLVVYIHQHVLHVVLDFSDQLNAVHKQSIEQGLAYIPLVCTQLSFDVVQE